MCDTSWWEAFGEPKTAASPIEAEEVASKLEAQPLGGGNKRDFLLVDVRRTDYEGGTVASSINLPAHTFFQTRPIVYQMCKQAGIKQIIFYCMSSNGRGPRCAGWMQDYLDDVGETELKSLVLKGGVKGWIKTFNGKNMDHYDEKVWTELFK